MDGPPHDYTTVGAFMLVSGLTNIGFGFVLFLTLVWLCVGVVYLPVMIVGVIEVVIGLGILQGQVRPTAMTVAILGMVAGVLSMNVIALIMESLSLAWLGKPEVKAYLAPPGPHGG